MGFEDTVVAGRYRLLGQAGQGAMGVVWRAQDERLGRLVALKQVVHDDGLPESQRFRRVAGAVREARLAARVKHPHAVTVYDVVEDVGSVYLVLEFLPSRSLTDLLLESGPLPAAKVAALGSQIAAALTVAHAEGVLHRDVTPNNILVTEDGTAMITDFGISHAVGDGTMTGGGLVAGTPAFLAPEVADGGESAFASDVYSLGATLYTALEGAPPSGVGDNPIALLKRIANGDITPPAHSGPLSGVLLRLLHHDPDRRPSMAEAEALLSTVSTERPAAVPVAVSPRSFRRHAVFGVAACVVAAAVVTGVALAAGSAAPLPPAPTAATVERTVAVTTTAVVAEPPSLPSATQAGCSAQFTITTSWPGGAQALVTVHNDRKTRMTAWTVSWTQSAGVRVRELWNGTLSQQGQAVSVTNAAWNGVVEPGGSVSFGLNEISVPAEPETPRLGCR